VNRLNFIVDSLTETPELNVGLSHALLEAVANDKLEGPLFRLHVPDRVLAFGMIDRTQPGYGAATRIASAHGYAPVERLAGGRAAVFHQQTLAFSWAIRDQNPQSGIVERFTLISSLLNRVFRDLGLDSRIGEVPGEYCRGEYSINIGGNVKVMGVGQRLIKGAAHVGGVIVVDGASQVRDVLIPVYRALRIDWDPRTAGALADRAPGLDVERVSKAIGSELNRRYEVVQTSLPDAIVERARQLASNHVPRAA
jgi:octanoyl-[GcvH]:protein N-octanoyltransferase